MRSDANGNITTAMKYEPLTAIPAASAAGYSYNDKKNRLLTADGNSFTYDNEGQINSGYANNFGFDYEHRLTGTSTDRYYYHGNGQRFLAIRNTIATRYIYDAAGNLIAEADGSYQITKYYIYGLGLIAMITPANQTYSYHFNATGSTIAMTDTNQNIVNKYAYDPFGNIINQSETVSQPFKFVGQYGVMTEPNGFYYMRARYYDPNVGRFISEDPIGFGGGDVNLYGYVGNNPVNLVDPIGQLAFFWHFGITLVATGDLGLAWNTMMVDVGTQGESCLDTRQHAMAGILPDGSRQTYIQAIEVTDTYIQLNIHSGNIPGAIHAAQDLATPEHAGQPWTGYTVAHVLGDVFPSWSTIKQAYQKTVDIISGTYRGGKP